MKKNLFLCFILLIMVSCGGKQPESRLSSEEQAMAESMGKNADAFASALQDLQMLELYMRQYDMDPTIENLKKMVGQSDDCQFLYDEDDMSAEQKIQCLELKLKMDSMKMSVAKIAENAAPTFRTKIVEKNDYLMEKGAEAFPFYAQKGDKLFYRMQLQQAGSVKIYNVDSKQQISSFTLSKNKAGEFVKEDSLMIPNSAIYLIEVTPGKNQYLDLTAELSVSALERVGVIPQITEEIVEGTKSDFRATSVKGVQMKNLFEEPRKFTLRGQLKSMFSGTSRALVALQVPSGATDVMYSLRISTNEGDRSQDGQFYDNMCTSYKKVKFLGLPLYESQNGSGLLSTLLGDNQPLREEDAYINMYVFYDAAQAKKFQDGASASGLKYSVDYSTLGTQSCNGRIPANGKKTIYLAFENERMRYNNYVWLEAVSAVPSSEYFRTQYSLK